MRNNFKAGYKKRLTLDTSKTSVIAIGVSNLEQILAESIDREFLKKRLQEFLRFLIIIRLYSPSANLSSKYPLTKLHLKSAAYNACFTSNSCPTQQADALHLF